MIVDFAPHTLEFLRTEHAHRRLGFRADTVAGWLDQCGLDVAATRTIDPPPGATDERLTVSLWLATNQPSTTPSPTTSTTTEQDQELVVPAYPEVDS